ncbi:Hsp70 family protein [Laspinema olomoucense]|uniref:Hsp70 family protein n=1 Tax=Laspinema olomoucense TaxID=3231600 RepID=UPI0021BB5C3B|nr:Hsp70 family protein [Laspinema sp. D3c]MCT7993152.1 Hsp70 family protein [Laspinema sp. D3c]
MKLNLPNPLGPFFNKLRRFFSHLWDRLKAVGNPLPQLRRSCQSLEQLLALENPSYTDREKIWKTYAQVLDCAARCDAVGHYTSGNGSHLIQVIQEFEPRLGELPATGTFSAKRSLRILLKRDPVTAQALNAAWRLSARVQDPSFRQEIQQFICVETARIGEDNELLRKLVQRRQAGRLDAGELEAILSKLLGSNSFQENVPWKAFFLQLTPRELPRLHPVYGLIERWEEAANLAEELKDYRCAIAYRMRLGGKENALQLLSLSERIQSAEAIAQAHQKLGSCFWDEGDYITALEHFQKAGDLERASDCHYQLGNLPEAVQLRPSIRPEWIAQIRDRMETTVRSHLEHQEFLPSVRLLKALETAWRNHSPASRVQSEASRTQHLLGEILKTARAGFEGQLTEAQGVRETEVYKAWSRLEEAAGNYQEAAMKAQQAQDYFTASLLFEKAGAFGQAVSALDEADRETSALVPQKKAQLLEQGGDFFRAGLLYEELGETDRAIAMYEQAKEFDRAAELRRQQVGDRQVVFDERFVELLTKAGRIEELAELYAAKAYEPERSPEEKAQLFRRIKELGDRGLVSDRLLNLVARELPQIEALDRRKFEQQAPRWVQAATEAVLRDYIDAIGLDLGTSNSVVCLYNHRTAEVEVVEWQGKRQIPSVFAIDPIGRELVGVPIPELLGKSPRAIVTQAKRKMGTETKFKAGGVVYRPEEISARIINCARQLARDRLRQKIVQRISKLAAQAMGTVPPEEWVTAYLDRYPLAIPLSNVVITVPAYFNDAQKQATKTAGMLADINVLRLIHEPTAACLAQNHRVAKNETLLIADLGAGTFDLSIIEVEDKVFEVLEIQGDNSLGSADLDDILYQYFATKIEQETGYEIASDRFAATRLRQACEELKIELSTRKAWTIQLPQFMKGTTIDLELTRQELEQLAAPWLNKIRQTCQKITHKPHRVLLIGGGAVMPAVRQCIRDVFGQEASADLDPLTAVARGAVLQAAILLGALQETILLDVVPFSLGIKSCVSPTEFKFDVLIPKHTTIPTKKSNNYTTIEDNQSRVHIQVFQGESPIPEENFKIGEFILEGIFPAKAGVPKIDVTFDIDTNCLLKVSALDLGTGNQCGITIADSHLLTPAQQASLKTQFYESQTYQEQLGHLQKIAADLTAQFGTVEKMEMGALTVRLQERLQFYECHQDRYRLTETDNQMWLELYRDRPELEMKTRLAQDRWDTLKRSGESWIQGYQSLDWKGTQISDRVKLMYQEGSNLLQRTREAVTELTEVVGTYLKWLSAIENLTVNPDGNAEELAQHFLSLHRYSEAMGYFKQIEPPLSLNQVELGLEIYARSRQLQDYHALLQAQAQPLGIHNPDFTNLNHSVQIYAASVACIQVNSPGHTGNGSGFFIGGSRIATNRHVVVNETTGECVLPHTIQVMTQQGMLQVTSIQLPHWGPDDVAILHLKPTSVSLTPLRLGFSELVEVGERVLTLGFPAVYEGKFEENLYCNVGLINRIRPQSVCSDRVLEVSIPLQGGISGSPLLNQWGEVIGLLSFILEQKRQGPKGDTYSERSFYAIPVSVLRRLCLT